MLLQIVLVLGVVSGLLAHAPPTSTCQDLDTQACQRFQKAKPDFCSDPAFYSATCKRFCGMCPIECYSCPTPVLDPSDCNVTLSCGLNMTATRRSIQLDELGGKLDHTRGKPLVRSSSRQVLLVGYINVYQSTCMTKHLKVLDGHDEYIMTCEKKAVCDSFLVGFGIGKRDILEVEEVGEKDLPRYQRDVSLNCCDTDFCNMPSMTTTTAGPTTTTQVTSSSSCHRDIVFLIDGNVGSKNFTHSVDFIREVVNNLNVGPNEARLAVVEYSSHPQIKWYLNQYTDKTSALQQINRLRYMGGTTRLGDALEAVRVKILGSGNGERPAAENVVIVLTDGQSTDNSDILQEANNLFAISRDVVSIVVGHGVGNIKLYAIASGPDYAFHLRSYSNLPSIVPKLLNLICT